MFLLFSNVGAEGAPRTKLSLVNLEYADAIIYTDGTLTTTAVPTQAKYYKDNDEGIERFNDIVEALLNGDVDLYDLGEEVGYWKKKEEEKPEPKTTHRKTTPKKAAE